MDTRAILHQRSALVKAQPALEIGVNWVGFRNRRRHQIERRRPPAKEAGGRRRGSGR